MPEKYGKTIGWLAVLIAGAVLCVWAFPRAFPFFPDDWGIDREAAREIALERLGSLLNILQFAPADQDETDFRDMCLIDLDMLDHGWESPPPGYFTHLGQIEEKGSYNANYAISLLNNSDSYRDYLFDMVEMPAVLASPETRQYGSASDHLLIRPNPASDKVFIDYLATETSSVHIRVFDVSGKQVMEHSVSQTATTIELDISSLEEGFYFISLTDKGSGMAKTGKLIKAGQGRK